MCGTDQFVGLVNTGKKYYCNSCMRKINESSMDYWKPCSQVEFFQSMLSHMKKRNSKKSNMFTNLKEQLRQIDKEAKNKKYQRREDI